MDRLVRAAVFGDSDEKDARPLAHLGARSGRWRSLGVDPRSLHGPRPRRDARASRCRRSTCAAWRTTRRARSSAPRFARRPARSSSRSPVQRLHIPTSVRPSTSAVMLGGRTARRVPRPGVHSGRPLPGQREEVRRRSEDRGRCGEGAGAKKRSPRASTTSTSTRRRWSTSRKPTLDEQQQLELRGRRSISSRRCARSSRRASRFPSAARSAKSARRTARSKSCARTWTASSARCRKAWSGLSKISVQSGTSHGGVVLADGSIADVKLDLDTLETSLESGARRVRTCRRGAARRVDAARQRVPQLSRSARRPRSISRRTSRTCCSTTMPAALRNEIYEWLRTNAKDERKSTDSDEQFFYKTRKKALGPFKQQLLGPAGRRRRRRWRRRTTRSSPFCSTSSRLATPPSDRDEVREGHRPIHRVDPTQAVAVAAAPDDAELSD